MNIVFISDLHLCPERPAAQRLFFDFLDQHVRTADALYILGDLFEYWIGEDAAETLGQSEVLLQLRRATTRGMPVYFMRGNRDFLIGDEFAAATGCTLLPDPTIIQIRGERVLLTHGDALCTDDAVHQEFRASITTNLRWQREFLQRSVRQRIKSALDARSRSALHKSMISMDIMDVNEDAVQGALLANRARHMIHGHTHRPAIHAVKNNGAGSKRVVLGDWYTQSSVLYCSDTQGRPAADMFHLVPAPPIRDPAAPQGIATSNQNC